jgi:hypothetical protein
MCTNIIAVLDADFIGMAGAVLTMHSRRDDVQAAVVEYVQHLIAVAAYEPEARTTTLYFVLWRAI